LVYNLTHDGIVYRTACTVHGATGPCPDNGQPALDGLLHTFLALDQALIQWRLIAGGQRGMVVHHDIPDVRHVYASGLPGECPCGAEVLTATPPEIGA
jgi:hypothetical protein